MNSGVIPVVALRNVTRSFEQGGTRIDVLRGVDLAVMPGEIVALLGPSGSGKSTMLQAVGLLEGGFGGEISIAGTRADQSDAHARTMLRRDHLGFVYQFHHLLPDFDARENVVLPQLVAGKPHDEARTRAEELLTALGLAQRMDHRPSQLSGGEQQRCRGRPRACEQAQTRARGRAYRKSGRKHRRPRARTISPARTRDGERGAYCNPQRAFGSAYGSRSATSRWHPGLTETGPSCWR